MKLLILPTWYYDLDGHGGGLFFREQALVLRRAGVEAAILYARLDPRQPLRARYRFDDDEGLPTFRRQQFALPKVGRLLTGWWVRRFASLYPAYTARYGRPDLLHAHSFVGGLVARHIARREGLPYLITEHLSAFLRGDLPRRLRGAARRAFDDAAAVVAVSRGLRDHLAHYTTNPHLLIIPNMTDTDLFRPAELPSPPSGKTLRLISIGDPVPTKGLDLLVEAVGRAQRQWDGTITLALGDRVPDRELLFPGIRKYGLEKQVTFLGFLSREGVRDALRRADVYISASRFETFGVAMVEAMACGLPVIATRTAGALDVVPPHAGLLVPTGDAEALTRGIMAFIRGEQTFDPHRIRQYAVDHFSTTAVCRQLTGLYGSILATHPNYRL